jgi:hypothetical protein
MVTENGLHSGGLNPGLLGLESSALTTHLAMMRYDFEIIYQRGSEIPADFLSQNVICQIFQANVNNLWIKNHQFEFEQGQKLDVNLIQMQNRNSHQLHEKLLEQ